jgi:hypothetical protein
MIPGHDHDVEISGGVEHPVELRQRIMQVGYEKQSQRSVPNSIWIEGKSEWTARAGDQGGSL